MKDTIHKGVELWNSMPVFVRRGVAITLLAAFAAFIVLQSISVYKTGELTGIKFWQFLGF